MKGQAMAQVFPGRYTARIEGSFVVFLIGMRVNRFFAVRKWVPVARAMPPMLEELARNKELGFLSGETLLSLRGPVMVQYWKSFEQLTAYAQARDAKHLPAWAAFNRLIGGDGTVGIWHETYLVEPHHSETVYVNMPRWGLSRAGEHMQVTGLRDSARQRITVD
jgi:Domain of unknown function (DUF4188)